MSQDRRQDDRRRSIFDTLSPLAAELARKSLAHAQQQDIIERERRQGDRRRDAARIGLACNPSWKTENRFTVIEIVRR